MEQEFDKFAKGYRNLADQYIKISGETSDSFAVYKAKKLVELTPKIQPILTALDFGCGDGIMTAHVDKQLPHAKLFGLDPSSKSIDIAKQNHPKISFHKSSGTTIDFEDNFFDLVFASCVFHHIDHALHETYLAEILRILRPGGAFVMMEHNPLNPLTLQSVWRNPMDKNAKLMSHWKAKKLFGKKGKISTNFYFFFPALLKKLRFMEKYLRWLPLGAQYACILTKKS